MLVSSQCLIIAFSLCMSVCVCVCACACMCVCVCAKSTAITHQLTGRVSNMIKLIRVDFILLQVITVNICKMTECVWGVESVLAC